MSDRPWDVWDDSGLGILRVEVVATYIDEKGFEVQIVGVFDPAGEIMGEKT